MAAAIDRAELARELFPDQAPGFPYVDFDLQHIRMPRDDDMGIPSDDDDVDDEEIQTETGFGSVIGERSGCAAAAPLPAAALVADVPAVARCSRGQPSGRAQGEV